MWRDYISLSIGNLKHRGIRSWLTLIGIFIGITAVVALISVGDGLQIAVSSQFGIDSTEVISVQAGGIGFAGPPGSGDVNPLLVKDLEEIQKLSLVERAIRRNIPSGKLEFNNRVVFGFATNVPNGEDRKFMYDTLGLDSVEVGRLLKDGDDTKVMLGYNFYVDKVGLGKIVRPGDTILLQGQKFEVVGITKKKGSFIYDNIVYVNSKPLEDLFKYGDNIDIIGVHIKDPKQMDKAKEEIEKVLRRTRNVQLGEEDFEVSTPQAALETVNSVLGGVQAFILIVASLSIIIGAIGIINTMTTSVMERKKEIGIMKSIGATNEQIFLQFFFESGLLGLVGGFVGAVFGTIIGFVGTSALNSFIGSDISPKINFGLIGLSLLGSFLIGAAAGIIPALSAAKENPVEALRG
ncbi:MAG: ABC transporter permease [archaeon]|nr:ABC transporter permease [archaeon]